MYHLLKQLLSAQLVPGVLVDHMDKYNMIEVGSFAAIRSEEGELYHLIKVEEKNITEESFMDASCEHGILKREPYIVRKWYSFQKESKKFALFFPQSANTMKSIVPELQINCFVWTFSYHTSMTCCSIVTKIIRSWDIKEIKQKSLLPGR